MCIRDSIMLPLYHDTAVRRKYLHRSRLLHLLHPLPSSIYPLRMNYLLLRSIIYHLCFSDADMSTPQVYLAEEDQANRRARKKAGGNSGKMYTEGWIEFEDKKVARGVTQNWKPATPNRKHDSNHAIYTVLLTSLYYRYTHEYLVLPYCCAAMSGVLCTFKTKARPLSALLTKYRRERRTAHS